VCPLKPRCCPRAPARKISRSIYEGARDLAREIAKTEAYQTSRHQRKRSRCYVAAAQFGLDLGDRHRRRRPGPDLARAAPHPPGARSGEISRAPKLSDTDPARRYCD
jgi:hypothetical protein